jgi:hypothetical protein
MRWSPKQLNRFYSVFGTIVLATLWLVWITYFETNFFGTLATAAATACLIHFIQSRLQA